MDMHNTSIITTIDFRQKSLGKDRDNKSTVSCYEK